MPESEKKILEEVEYLRDKYFTYDEPVPFCGLYLYPVSVRNYNEFMTSNACLLLNKNDDPMGIKFTHLDYLLSKISDEKEGVLWSMRFSKIIELCFHILPGMKCSKCGKYIPYDQFFTEERVKLYQEGTDEDRKKFFDCDCGEGKMVASLDQKKDEKSNKTVLLIDGHEIDSNNFNKLRKFILYQNPNLISQKCNYHAPENRINYEMIVYMISILMSSNNHFIISKHFFCKLNSNLMSNI